jgi:hypothetical protein
MARGGSWEWAAQGKKWEGLTSQLPCPFGYNGNQFEKHICVPVPYNERPQCLEQRDLASGRLSCSLQRPAPDPTMQFLGRPLSPPHGRPQLASAPPMTVVDCQVSQDCLNKAPQLPG